MKPFGSALGALALSLASPSCALAADGPSAGGPGQACDMICALRAYIGTDHMVTLVPANAKMPQTASTIVRKTAVRHRVSTRWAARKPGHGRTPVATEPMPRQTAQLSPPMPVATIPPNAPKPVMRLRQAIPGSAPLVTPRFEPPSQQ